MKKEESITADELLERLSRDSAYKLRLEKRLDEVAKVRERRQRALAPLMYALRQRGFQADSLADLVRTYAPLDAGVVPLMQEWFDRFEDEALKTAVLNVLANTTGKIDGAFLANQFDASVDDNVKWQIAATIEMTRPKEIDEWLFAAAREPKHGNARAMLVLAAGRILPPAQARQVALEAIDDHPGNAAIVLRRVGQREDIGALEKAAASELKWIRGECKKAIAKISQRFPG